ncbi:protein phosphatase 2C domain-containing protein [Bacillus sp. FJAT-50079]|uniref:protein phosphatase 2C domain-containing protein n=1 Tax=Bacillus sp. FJAT-50079 TaxID=2833577 RepID=UPI001BCA3FC6|nr:protein phosphatase 2C domain-containing protein [Bacillus sp. FJAT-50079]MBS4208095.1 protein phosphatase 2C domain-containing protein [Bacillus sp. FJAT-50079]
MNIESITLQGSNEWNEDALILNEKLGIYGVADGATSLVPFRSEKGETGGRLASQIVKCFFEKLDEPTSQSLEELLVEANDLIGNKMKEAGIDTSLKDNVWTTGAAIIKVEENQIEYVQAGDCMIIAMYKDGSYRLLTRDQISFFDNQTRLKWVEAIDEGLNDRQEIRKKIEPVIRKHKSKINTNNGYSVLDGSREAGLYLECGKINRLQLAGIIICTDGLFIHDEKGTENKVDPIKNLVQQTSIVGLEGYANYLIALENKDPDCLRFPRFKKSDDKTAVCIEF